MAGGRAPRYRALLIGASNYESAAISPLPFVAEDLERMAHALNARGFEKVKVAQKQLFSLNEIDGDVVGFLQDADPGDRLLVVLSGHGLHSRGREYLIPEDFRENLSVAKRCVEIDWSEEIEASRAAQVVFLVDACREGVQGDTMAASLKQWEPNKVRFAKNRKVAYVYACSQAEFARYVRATDTVRAGVDVGTLPEESFSLFSRAVTDLLLGHGTPPGARPVSELGEFHEAVQERVAALHRAYGKSREPQRVRVLTEEPAAGFELFPPLADDSTATDTTELTWAAAVDSHPAWKLTDPAQATAVDRLKEICGALAASYARDCARAERKLAEDRWYDRELAERTAERLGFLLRYLTEGSTLSPTEAALLAVLPFATQAHWAREAARRELPVDELTRFLELFPRINRRLRSLKESQTEALRDVHWWGYHRWLAQRAEVYFAREASAEAPDNADDSDLDAAPDWMRAELRPANLLRYLKEQRIAPAAAPGTLRSTELADAREVAPSTAYEHTVRERLVSALVKAAHALAIDPADLPEVLVEHLGISDSVSLDDLHATIRKSYWRASGTGRMLGALCQHPAVELALKQHAETVDVLLRDINHVSAVKGSSLEPLRSLPAYAHGQEVKPSGATPANLSAGIRFRLADDRVQELLMGEQLYGERELAIRELYQNALDACRYREARLAYLHRTGAEAPPWQGRIRFAEGVDERGRPYLECADNGIGMGVTELSRSFSQGGARFVDLPEYLEERTLWDALEPKIQLHPVSRFGLGVLSYFMIADEITVWTSRLNRNGRPGRRVKVTIAGPGNLFRVEDDGPAEDAGTTVRLIGSPGSPVPAPGEELSRHLWVSPFRTTTPDGTQDGLVWEPGRLHVTQRVPGAREPDGIPQQADRGAPFGLTTQRTPYTWSAESLGPVAHTGPARGDARQFEVRVDGERFGRRLPDLPRYGLSPHRPRIATDTPGQDVWWTDGPGAVLVDGIAADRPLFGRAVDLHGTRQARLSVDRKQLQSYDEELVHQLCMGAVDDLVDSAAFLSPAWVHALHEDDPVLAEAVVARAIRKNVAWDTYHWTMEAGRAGMFPPDLLLLPAATGTFHNPTTHHDIVASQLVLCMPEPVVRWRLRTLLGLDADLQVPVARPSDLNLLSVNPVRGMGSWAKRVEELSDAYRKSLNAKSPDLLSGISGLPAWRPAGRPVTVAELLTAASTQQAPAAEVAQRLAAIGYEVENLGPLAAATVADLPLLALDEPADGGPPSVWLPPGACVHLAHLLVQRDPRAAAARLAALGYALPGDLDGLPALSASAHDKTLLRALLAHPDILAATPEHATGVSLGQLDAAAVQLRWNGRQLTQRLQHLGLTPAPGQRSFAPHTLKPLIDSGITRRLTRTIGPHEYGDFGLAFDSDTRQGLIDLGFHPQGSPVSKAMLKLMGQSGRRLNTVGLGPRTREAVLTPTGLRAAALLANVKPGAVRTALKRDGHTAWVDIESGLDDTLVQYGTETAPPLFRRSVKGKHIGLAALASAAIRLQRPFREVAALATELGLRHEAETWFDGEGEGAALARPAAHVRPTENTDGNTDSPPPPSVPPTRTGSAPAPVPPPTRTEPR
ncbi:HD domain-containing protein [Streptomyces boluensis]|uniref:iHD-CE domain-containing protein n=1 Tax=Streptomyces boluensis TaxID=1775135 RepID=A0A964XN72_9ACTN|nr:caspase family protein [Streptomyces boluensis]NBE55344.1 hypothetical protein [Streptomyces boluensis]